MMNFDTLIERTQEVRQAATDPSRTIKQRMAEAAADMSRAGDNQQRVAERGREPGLLLQRGSTQVTLTDWAGEILSALRPIA